MTGWVKVQIRFQTVFELVGDRAPVVIEAECLDASDSIGSMRLTGELDTYSRASTLIIALPEPPGYDCLADESEGRAPCFLDGPLYTAIL